MGLKKGFIFILLLSFFLVLPFNVYGEDYKSQYVVEYFLTKSLKTKVKFSIKVTHLRSNVYVKKLLLSFPDNFKIENIKASDSYGAINPKTEKKDGNVNVTLELSNPNIGKGSQNKFYLEFYQNSLFQRNGNIWEVILPTLGNKENSKYSVIVYLPKGTNKKISIAKPQPSKIIGNKIIWDDVKTRIIYAVFGNKQYYLTNLRYHLKNQKLFPVYTYVAFPPDTLYQKIYINNIEPQPSEVIIDDDGNFLGKYFLKPKETKDIIFKGDIVVFSQPRDEVAPVIRSQFVKQKKYLLSKSKYWNIDQINKIKPFSTVNQIYRFVTDYLSYDYSRVVKSNKRLGAKKALDDPTLAVCVEFSDLFVAIAREKGIFSREIEGYGFTQDKKLRPLSLVSDILHSWPEYFDLKNQVWVPVDPTWENTSRIDYFNSLDLNHIVFAIHGKKSNYPLPAGMYKFEESKDVSVEPSKNIPKEKVKISLLEPKFEKSISDKGLYNFDLKVINNSNVFVWNVPLSINSQYLKINPQSKKILVMAPFETKKIKVSYQSNIKNKIKKSSMVISLYNKPIFKEKIEIFPYYLKFGIKFVFGVFIFFVILLPIKFLMKKR